VDAREPYGVVELAKGESESTLAGISHRLIEEESYKLD
jgi:hypothetical protein